MRSTIGGVSSTTRGRQLGVTVRAENCLIVNTKAGAHALIGIHLAKRLMTQGHSVTLMNDGDQVQDFQNRLQSNLVLSQPWPRRIHSCNMISLLLQVERWCGQILQILPVTPRGPSTSSTITMEKHSKSANL